MSQTGIIRALVWDENPPHAPKEVYPNSINGAVAEGLEGFEEGVIEATTVSLDDPEQGITEAALENADVLFWWGHARHGQVSDETVARVVRHVHERGMGFIALHSAHYSKPFKAVLNATGRLMGGWRDIAPPDAEEITVSAPRHPIAEGVTDFVLPAEEMYGAPFDVPPPQCVVLHSYFPNGGETFPCGLCFTVGTPQPPAEGGPKRSGADPEGVGRVFYFRPGHETYPTYFDNNVRKILFNAAKWAAHRA